MSKLHEIFPKTDNMKELNSNGNKGQSFESNSYDYITDT